MEGLKSFAISLPNLSVIFFQLLFALVPPAGIWGGWLSFFVSLVVIGALTAIVGDLASIFGCLVGLNDAVTGEFFFVVNTTL